MNTQRIKDNSIKGLILFSLCTIMNLTSGTLNAQTAREMLDTRISEKVKAWEDSVRKLNPRKFPIYLGAELSLSFPQSTIQSKIPALSGVNTGYCGTNLGGILGSPIGKLKANVGMYYSNSTARYLSDMLTANVSASIYLLRLKTIKYHSFEPYLSAGFGYQKTRHYGFYLPTAENGSTTSTNYSASEPPLLGSTGSVLMNVSYGIEYQLESDNNLFIHLFAEFGNSLVINSSASNKDFVGTSPSNMSSVKVGINFGILK